MPRADQQHPPAPRNQFIKARVSTEELRTIEAAARSVGLRPSAYVRGSVLDGARPPRVSSDPPLSPTIADAEMRTALDATRLDIARVHNNANQLVRLCHRGVVRDAALAASVDQLAQHCRDLIGLLGGLAR